MLRTLEQQIAWVDVDSDGFFDGRTEAEEQMVVHETGALLVVLEDSRQVGGNTRDATLELCRVASLETGQASSLIVRGRDWRKPSRAARLRFLLSIPLSIRLANRFASRASEGTL